MEPQTQTKKLFNIRFLLNGKSLSVIVDNSQLAVFYQRKKPEINIISVNKVESGAISEIEQYLKPSKSIWL
jgi:hypothetical protein